MIELTPLDVRKKRGDFAKALRGYDAQEVDVFLELVAERMEVLVKENLQLRERSERLGEQVNAQEGREQAVQEALVTAQELRQDVKEQAEREAQLLEREAHGRIEQTLQEADRLLDERRVALEELERHRILFLKAFRTLLERELDAVEVESSRAPLEDVTLDLELGRGSWTVVEEDEADDESAEADDESAEAVAAAETAEAVVSDDDGDADTVETVDMVVDEPAGAEETEAEESDTAVEVDADAEADAAEKADAVGGAESAAETESSEAAEGEAVEDSGGEDSLWLSSILKRDQQETD